MEDEKGNKLTPNQYLEFVLKEQEGYTESIMNKNLVRQLMKD